MRWHSQNLNDKPGSFGAGRERDRNFGGHLRLGPFGIYPSVSAPRSSRLFRLAPAEAREFSLSLREWTLRLEVWGREWEYRNRDPWWIRGVSVDLRDLVLGRPKYSTREVAAIRPILIPMPEGAYRGTCAIEEATWKRPRWPARRLLRADVKMEEPVPIPGKGENSWDCGEDAIHGMCCPASTVPEAIAEVVKSALSTRERHGGRNWRPQAVAAAAP